MKRTLASALCGFVAGLLAGAGLERALQHPEVQVATYELGREPWVWQPTPGDYELFVGNIKMGKSWAARARAARIRRLLAWDPIGDEIALGHGRVTVAQLEQLEERLGRGTVRLAVRPTAWDEKGVRLEFDRFTRAAWRIGRLCVKVEEGGALQDASGRYPDGFNKILREGRHRDLSLILVGQRFAQVPVMARDNASRLIVFRHGYEDAGEVAKRVSGAGVLFSDEQVMRLERGQYIEWTPTEGARMCPPLGTGRSTS